MSALPAAASVIVPAGHPQRFQPRRQRGRSSHLQLFQPEAQWPLHVGGLSCPATTLSPGCCKPLGICSHRSATTRQQKSAARAIACQLTVLSFITPGSCPRPILQGPSSGTLPSAIMPSTTSLSSRCMRRRSFHRWTVAFRSSCSRCICALHRILSHLARCSVRQSLTVYVPDLAIK